MGQESAAIGWERLDMDHESAAIGWERADMEQESAIACYRPVDCIGLLMANTWLLWVRRGLHWQVSATKGWERVTTN